METLLLIPREEKFITFKYYFKDRIFTASFRFESLSITFLDSLLVFIQWQWSTFVGSNIPFNLSNNFRTLFPRFLDSTEFVIFVICRHFRLEYWLLPLHCLSIFILLLSNISFRCLVTTISDQSFSKSFLNSLIMFHFSAKIK